MPIITIKTVKGAVLTSDEQKRELLKKMTDTFIEVVGEVARPYTYCLIEETPMYEWALAGEPLPAFDYLTGPEFAGLHAKSKQIMLDYMKSQGQTPSWAGASGGQSGGASDPRVQSAQRQWEHGA